MANIPVKFGLSFVDGMPEDSITLEEFLDGLPAIQRYVPELVDLQLLEGDETTVIGELHIDDQSQAGKLIKLALVDNKWNFPEEPDPVPPFDPALIPWKTVRMFTDRIFTIPAQEQGVDQWQGIIGRYQMWADHESEFNPDGGGAVGNGGYGGVK